MIQLNRTLPILMLYCPETAKLIAEFYQHVLQCFKPHYIFYLSLILAGFLAGLCRSKKGIATRAVTLILGVTLASEIISKILACTTHNNYAVYHFFQPVQALLWASFFYTTLQSSAKKTVLPLTAFMLMFTLVNSIFWQGLMKFPDKFTKLECLVLIFWSFCLFIEFLERPGKENIFKDRRFIICIAVLWFNLVSFPFFDFINLSIKKEVAGRWVDNVHYFSNYTYYTMLFLAMLLKQKPLTDGR
jgi:multisubunit Na+/H+ antiporter MnhG subunit